MYVFVLKPRTYYGECGTVNCKATDKEQDAYSEPVHYGCVPPADHLDAVGDEHPWGVDTRIRLFQEPLSTTWNLYGPASGNNRGGDIVTFGHLANAVLTALHDMCADCGLARHLWAHRASYGFLAPCSDLLNLYLESDAQSSGEWDAARERRAGIVWVRPRGKHHMEGNQTYGQMYDHLTMLRAFHSIERPMGIMTNYDWWRIVWLADNDTDNCLHGEDTDRAGKGRVLCMTPAWAFDDSELVPRMATALHRMWRSSIECKGDLVAQESSGRRQSHAILIKDDSWEWVSRSHRAWQYAVEKAIDSPWGPMPDANAAAFLLLRELGTGADGAAWYACDLEGRPCVLKMGHGKDDDRAGDPCDPVESGQVLWREAVVWRRVWGVEGVRTLRLAQRPALLMPYAETLGNAHLLDCHIDSNDSANGSSDDNNDDRDDTAAAQVPTIDGTLAQEVRTAIDKMAAHDICHGDLRWRHVGRIPCHLSHSGAPVGNENRETRIVLFDLARLSYMSASKATDFMARCLRIDTLTEYPRNP